MKSLLTGVVVVAVASLIAAQNNNCTCPDIVDVNCPSVGEFAVLFPHPDDCSMYCECEAEGCASELSCPPDLLFDAVLHVCNWPNDVSISRASVVV